MKVLDGKQTAEEIKIELKTEIEDWVSLGKKRPHLAAVLVGENAASRAYVNTKMKSCEQIGMRSTLIQLNSQTTEKELIANIRTLNNDEEIDGFIVQLPLPDHIDESKIIEAIDPKKDVDGFHPINLGKMMIGLPAFLPATPLGILELLSRNAIHTAGLHCVVVGRSNIVGTPMSILLSRKPQSRKGPRSLGDCTVTLAHSRTTNLPEITRQADLLIVALGFPDFIRGDMVKENVIVIDVGINRVDDQNSKRGYRLVGDVCFEEVNQKASWITPVPGGVGPMTVMGLIINTFEAVKRRDEESALDIA